MNEVKALFVIIKSLGIKLFFDVTFLNPFGDPVPTNMLYLIQHSYMYVRLPFFQELMFFADPEGVRWV